MQEGKEMNLYEACKVMYNLFLRKGYPGIDAIGDSGNVWVISPAPINPRITDYGLIPYFVSKSDGSISAFAVDEREDWNIIESAIEIDVPKEFTPRYS